MKIYNKKGLVLGIVWFILGGWLFASSILEPESFLPGQVKNIVLSLVLVLIGISTFIRAFSKKATREDMIEGEDERNRLVLLKTKAKMLDLMFWAMTIIMVLAMIGYAVTKQAEWAFVFTVPGILLAFYWISYIIVNIYYEKHN